MLLSSGDTMKSASDDFAGDPCSSMKRGTMVRAARALLGAVTRLLILADMVDVNNLLRALRTVSYFHIYSGLFIIFSITN